MNVTLVVKVLILGGLAKLTEIDMIAETSMI
jgi:hypothetical protein